VSAFVYKNNELYTSEVSISSIATKIGTPFYCYNANYIIQQFNFYKEAFANVPNYLIAYALKANSNQAIIKLLAKQGSGADIVSLGELHRAYKAGIPSSKIIFSGVGKSQEEIDAALMANIGCFNIESKAEFELLQTRAKELNKIAPISIRINPNIDAKTHPKIATGLASNKFGLEMSEAKALYALAAKTPELEILGVDVHIGSQICSLDPFDQAFALVAKFIAELQELNIYIKHVDIGGGLGIDYANTTSTEQIQKNITNYINLALRHFSNMGLKIICEPGRSIVGNSGILVSKTIYKKQSYDKNFIIIDAAMNDLLRPALYDAEQSIIAINEIKNTKKIIAEIVGPVCETGDYIAQNREVANLESGDLLGILGAGAYGAVMASSYNSRLLIPEILVQNNQWYVIRPRQTYKDLINLDKLPPWL